MSTHPTFMNTRQQASAAALALGLTLSMLFSILPLNVAHTLTDKPTLTAALNAALDPSVAKVP